MFKPSAHHELVRGHTGSDLATGETLSCKDSALQCLQENEALVKRVSYEQKAPTLIYEATKLLDFTPYIHPLARQCLRAAGTPRLNLRRDPRLPTHQTQENPDEMVPRAPQHGCSQRESGKHGGIAHPHDNSTKRK